MSITFTPSSIPLARPAAMLGVFRYDPFDAPGSKYQLLPNVLVLSIEAPGEGAHPGAARFRYSFSSPYGDPADPTRFEEVYPLSAVGNHVVNNDDRLVVRAYRSDGYYEILFDGFVQIPEAEVDREREMVTFQALGTPIREWDTPIAGALYRDGTDPVAGKVTLTDLPVRFNPDGKANSTQPGNDVNRGQDNAYPVFLDWQIDRQQFLGEPVDPIQDIWYLGEAARYLIQTGNPGQTYITNPTATYVETKLQARVATPDPDGPIDVNDPSTYTYQFIECPDLDVTGDPWPVALQKLIEPHGFGMAFRLSANQDGDPSWTFSLYYKDDAKRIKSVFLQPAGATYDPARTNVGGLKLARDGTVIHNRVVLETLMIRYEAAFLLAPAFVIAAGDASADALASGKWTTQPPEPQLFDPVTYREYILSEAGDDYWDFATAALKNDPPSLVSILGKASSDPAVPGTTRRRRPPLARLFSKDERGARRRAELYVSTDYTGETPKVYDPADGGTWQKVKNGGWALLDDQIGIRLTVANPENWNIGAPAPGVLNMPFPDGKVKVVTSMAAPDPNNAAPRFWFKLVCVIEGDTGLGVVMKRREASPTLFAITRHDDTRDRFRKEVVCASSPYAQGGQDKAVRDDTKKAQNHAAARRRQSELGPFAGSVTIPRLSTAYQVGDKINLIKGRNVSLVQNAAAAAGESDVLPTVVGMGWNFDGGQSTVLTLGDRRAPPPLRTSDWRLTRDVEV